VQVCTAAVTGRLGLRAGWLVGWLGRVNRTLGPVLACSCLHAHVQTVPKLLRGGLRWSWSWIATDGLSASSSWFRAIFWGPWPHFKFSLFWHLLASSCRAPSLTRGRVCILQRTSLSGQSREGPVTIHYCPIWDSPNPEGQIPASISHRNRVVLMYLRAMGSLFVAS
jgi:hypothetical protein